MDLSIGIVTYNGRALLEPCLASILRCPTACSSEIVVVDNGSTDDTVSWLQRVHPSVRVIANERNEGVARGNNQCLAAARGRYVLLLNNDTLLLPGTLDRLVGFADAHPDAGAAGGELRNPDGSLQASYFDFPGLSSEFLHATHLWALIDPAYPTHPAPTEWRPVDWLCSASLLVRRSAAIAVGGMDERYFMYSDETDFQYRLRRAGWQVYFVPGAPVIHLGGRSSRQRRRRELIYRGKVLFFLTHLGPVRTLLLRAIFVGASALKIPAWITMGLLPARHQRAVDEIRSNLDIIRVSLRPQSRV